MGLLLPINQLAAKGHLSSKVTRGIEPIDIWIEADVLLARLTIMLMKFH